MVTATATATTAAALTVATADPCSTLLLLLVLQMSLGKATPPPQRLLCGAKELEWLFLMNQVWLVKG